MSVSIGDHFPSVKLREKTDDGIVEISTDDFFANRLVVIFGVPGAFTPTCSETHLPGFLDNRDAIAERGVDEIAVVSVNDPHVMAAWAKASGGQGKIRYLADGNAELTRALGMDADMSGGMMGIRSRRYSMLVDNGVIRQINIEPGRGADVSGAATILDQLEAMRQPA